MQLLMFYIFVLSVVFLVVGGVVVLPFAVEAVSARAVIAIQDDEVTPPPPPPPTTPTKRTSSGFSTVGGYSLQSLSDWFLSFSEDPPSPVSAPSADVPPVPDTFVGVPEQPSSVVVEEIRPSQPALTPVTEDSSSTDSDAVSSSVEYLRETVRDVVDLPTPSVSTYVGSVEEPLIVSIKVLFSNVELEVVDLDVEEGAGVGFFSTLL